MLDWSWLIAGGSVAVACLAAGEGIRSARAMAGLRDRNERFADEVWEMREAVEARRRAESASDAKSRFLATVSHEVRTPLNGIIGMADLLVGTRLDSEQAAYVEAVKTSALALTTLIDEILDVSRIEAGKLVLVPEAFDLAPLVEGVAELLAPRAQGKGLEIATFFGPELPGSITADPSRLRQVLTNLAGNAVKFTERGGVGLTVESAGEGMIRFSVSDTGPGVAEHRRDAIFDDFEQGDSQTTRRHGGAGLGLAISRRLVRLMGGDIELSDRVGGGSVFSFTVRVEPGIEAPRLGCLDMEGQTVLIAAASAFQAPFLAAALDARGADVVVADRVDRAVAWIQGDRRPDILIVDCALGEVAAERLAISAAAAGVRRSFLLFSPYERRAFGQKLVSGYEGWLVKPVRAASLATRLVGGPTLGGRGAGMPRGLPARGPGLRVLLAEDNEINTLVAMNLLGRLGAQVVHAADGGSALALGLAAVKGEIPPFDAVVMDVSMPVHDGLEVTRRIRQAEAQGLGPAMRIVALTAHAFQEDHDRCLAAGMDAVTTKPLDADKLAKALRPETGKATRRAALSS